MRSSLRVISKVTVALLLLGACGESGDDEPTTSSTTTTLEVAPSTDSSTTTPPTTSGSGSPTTAAPTTAPPATTAPATTEPPTTAAPALTPGSDCTLGSDPDCIDPEGDGQGTYLLGGAQCMVDLASNPGLCSDLDGDGYAGYPDAG